MAVIQQNREIEIITPLGADVLLLREMTVTEELGRLFSINVELGSTEDIHFEDLLGQNVSIRINFAQGKRFFNGYVSSISQGVSEGRHARYYATIQPWLWFLTRTSDCRIFQNKTVPDIIKDILREQGYSDIEDRLKGNYRIWDYCVQYRETDFNFISRLMEQEGIYYYFKHEQGKHTFCLANDMVSHDKMPDCYSIPYHPPDEAVVRKGECISGWNITKQLQTGTYCMNEYDFEHPKTDLHVNSNIIRDHDKASFEIYDYPGEYVKNDEGNDCVKVRIQELQSQYERMQGNGNVRGLICGGLFKLNLFPRSDQNQEYLVTSVTHNVRIDSFDSASSSSNHYGNSFTVIESKTPYRAARLTPKPFVQGPQTAVVVGPSGEEIYTDKYGRVKVQFHWDRLGKKNENSSCWVRVSHPWAGKNWGMIAIPRIGQEVIVDFLEGDPDQPIITGRVYNAEQMPPYELPTNMTQTGILTRSSKDGSAANANELRFEDKKGSEQIYLHAEKNQDISVENDETHSIGHNRAKTIDNDETTLVKHDRTETVLNNETITVGVNRTEMVGSNESITIGSNRTKTVGASETASVVLQRTHLVGVNETIGVGGAQEIGIGAFQAVAVGAYQTINVGAYQNTNVGADQSNHIGANQSTSVGDNQSESVGGNASKSVKGNDSLSVDGDCSEKIGKNLVIDAGDSITIKTGSASISMKKDGTIVIKGKDITVDGSGKINIKAGGDIVMKGTKILQN
jgi:type VI secretion system secreted protein VgrG